MKIKFCRYFFNRIRYFYIPFNFDTNYFLAIANFFLEILLPTHLRWSFKVYIQTFWRKSLELFSIFIVRKFLNQFTIAFPLDFSRSHRSFIFAILCTDTGEITAHCEILISIRFLFCNTKDLTFLRVSIGLDTLNKITNIRCAKKKKEKCIY